MITSLDPYAILGVESDASPRVIAAAYRAAARETHPDAGGGAASFERVQESYDVLRDPVRRADYDAQVAEQAAGLFDATSSAQRIVDDARVSTYGAVDVKPVHVRIEGYRLWYAVAAVGTFTVLLLTSAARGLGILPHGAVKAGQHLILGNFVASGSSLATATSSHHGGSYIAVGGLMIVSLVVSLVWLARSRYRAAIVRGEIGVYLAVVAGLSIVNQSVVPTSRTVMVGVAFVLAWFMWAAKRHGADASQTRRVAR